MDRYLFVVLVQNISSDGKILFCLKHLAKLSAFIFYLAAYNEIRVHASGIRVGKSCERFEKTVHLNNAEIRIQNGDAVGNAV